MPPLKAVHYRKLVVIFEKEGFRFARQTGDHLIYTKAGINRPIVIPMYPAVPVFIIKNLLRTAVLVVSGILRSLIVCKQPQTAADFANLRIEHKHLYKERVHRFWADGNLAASRRAEAESRHKE